ncbi:SDR family oxidoreductase [Altererythrobacter salegens]|uniref:SDR family oxidoreductase n=1 Tax=Croceibacterium salegens TaxID=1737568 RepID=A0A6I4SQB5_9SPHN|nr:SDR family oxidoreductase [Croceibacterium salegens]
MSVRKSVFVTGAGSGIGRAIAQKYAHEGWFVGLADMSEQGMEETVAGMPGGFSYSHKLDVSDRAAWDEALRIFARAAGGRIDCVVNNAGISLGGPLEEYTTEEIDRIIAVNFAGVVYGAQSALPYLKETAPGSTLINTASAAAIHGMANQSLYGATKAAVRSLTESLDAEWAIYEIKVRSLMPSFIDTPLLQNTPNRTRNVKIRDAVVEAGLEFTPVEVVADTAFASMTSDQTHHLVGKTARRLKFTAKWMPGYLKKRARLLAKAHDKVSGK